MSAATRTDGFYWVRRTNYSSEAVWQPGYFLSPPGRWFVIGERRMYDDSEMEEIGPQIMPPGEVAT